MQKSYLFYLLIPFFVILLMLSGSEQVSVANETPLKQQWAPSEFGLSDQVGSVNWITSSKVLDSLKLVKQGKVATLGKVYQSDAPTFGQRNWKLIIPGLPTAGPLNDNDMVYNDEYVTAELGQVGTQFDGLGHIGVRTSKGDFFYNGKFLQDFGTSYGLNHDKFLD